MWEDEFIASQARMVRMQETAIINHYEREMEDMKIQMNRDVEAKINQLEKNILERDIEAVRFQIDKSQERMNCKPCCAMLGLLIVALVISFCIWWKYKK
jgi:excinuclease UvrABC ATPase subunit